MREGVYLPARESVRKCGKGTCPWSCSCWSAALGLGLDLDEASVIADRQPRHDCGRVASGEVLVRWFLRALKAPSETIELLRLVDVVDFSRGSAARPRRVACFGS